MPPRRRLAVDLPDVFLGSHAINEDLVTTAQLRGTGVRRVMQGVYRPAWVPESHGLRCAAAALILPDAASVTGRSAVTLQGLSLAHTTDDVEVVVPALTRSPRIRGVVVRQSVSPWPTGSLRDGVRLAHPLRVAFDLAARHPLPRATAHLDAAARHGLVDLDAFGDWLRTCHDNDVVDVRAALAHADPRAESLPESEVRVVLRQAGYSVVVQHVIRHRGQRLLRADLALPELCIAILYDGAWHALRTQLERDRAQLRELSKAGWLVVHVTADLLRSPHQLVAAVGAAVAQRRSPS